MTPEQIDLTGIMANFPLAAVVVYLFREVQRLHAERAEFLSKQLTIFQNLALDAKNGEGKGV